MQTIAHHEKQLAEYALKRFQALSDKVQLIGPQNEERVALFSFVLKDQPNFNQI